MVFAFHIAWVVGGCQTQLSQRGLRKSALSLPPRMTDQRVIVPVVSHEMAVAEPAQTKPHILVNLAGFTECRGSLILQAS